jgi:hypothetical protein
MAEKKKAEELPLDLFTPLQEYAHQAHELYNSFAEAGFTEGEAWELMIRHLPEWDLEAPDFIEIDEEQEE